METSTLYKLLEFLGWPKPSESLMIQAVSLVYVGGKTQAEAAKLCGVDAANLNKKVSRLRKEARRIANFTGSEVPATVADGRKKKGSKCA